MRYLILSDIHANLEALEAVLAAEGSGAYDSVLMLGDLVGYGADPNGVIDRVRALNPALGIRGNHDKVASGVEDAQGFNTLARAAALWTYDVLTAENRAYLAALPAGPVALDGQVEICHGAPFDEDAYIFEDLDAIRAAKAAEHPVCLFGHTHIPLVFTLSSGAFDTIFPVPADTLIQFRPESRYLINAGSIGQPRDGDPRAAYAILDLERQEMWLRRVEYAVAQAQDKIIKAGLPEALAQRLAMGR